MKNPATTDLNDSTVFNTRKPAIGLLLIFILLYLFPLGSRPLFIPDETRYAEVPREMLQSGDWLVPRLDGLRYFEKPPMGYWLDAVSITLFGKNEFASRLDTAVAVGLTGYFIFLLVSASGLPRKTAYSSALIYLTSSGVYGVGTFSVLDSLLTLFLTAGISWFYLAVITRKTHFWILSGVAFGCALMTKGLLAYAIPVMVLTPWLLWINRYEVILRQSWLVIAVSLVCELPWAIAIHLKEPDYWHYFFWVEHIQRFTAANAQHKAPFYYYIMFFPVVAFPWISYIPAAINGLKQSPSEQGKNLIKLCIVWMVLPFIFFSVSSGKLVTYIIPLFPALAILLGVGINNYIDSTRRSLVNKALVTNAAVLILLLVILTFGKTGIFIPETFENQTWKYVLLATGLVTGVIASIIALKVKSHDKLLVIILLMIAPTLVTLNFALPERLYMSKAPAPIFMQYKPLATHDALVITDATLIQAAAWYLERDDIYLIDGGEVSYGLTYPDSQYKFLDFNKFRQLVDDNINRHPILFFCKTSCNPDMEAYLRNDHPAKYSYGNFVLLYYSPEPQVTKSTLKVP